MQLLEYEFFKELGAQEQQIIEAASKPVALPIGTILYYEGDVCGDILFLKRGKVKVYLSPESVGAGEMTLYYIAPGEQCLVNTFSTVTAGKALASAVVDESIEGWLVPREQILWLINHSESYRNFKIELCGKRIAILMNLIKSIKFDQLDQRLLNWLYVQGKDTLHITHDKIASILGVSREAVSRNLKKLEASGSISLSRGKISIAA